MKTINDLQAGKAGEYLVCADLIMQGYIAFPSEQGLHFDVVADVNGKLIRIQVKTTREPRAIPQRKVHTPGYLFAIRRCGKGGRRNYSPKDVDIFALVALDSKSIGYIPASEVKQTMVFRSPLLTDKYHDKKINGMQDEILKLRGEGLTYNRIVEITGKDKAYIGRVVRGTTNHLSSGRYLSDYLFTDAIGRL